MLYPLKKMIYLDNCATTKVSEEVISLMSHILSEDFGNPSSKHVLGLNAENYLSSSAETIAQILDVAPKEIIFTSGATESNNTAIFSAAKALRRRGRHIITSPFEHESTAEPIKLLEREGFEVTYLYVDKEGQIDFDELSGSIRDDTILVSIMHVNNEIGSAQDLQKIGQLIKEKNSNTIFHTDAVQGFGKYEIHPRKLGIDMLSASAHKFHGPKGVGFLYVSSRVNFKPFILGGGQQRGARSGTENVAGVAAMALAAKHVYGRLNENTDKMRSLRDYLIDSLTKLSRIWEGKLSGAELEDITSFHQREGREFMASECSCKVKIHSGLGSGFAPHITSASFFPIKSEVLLHALEEEGIFVSSGSACSSNKNEASHTLLAIGLSKEEADSVLRFSLSHSNTKEEIDTLICTLSRLAPLLSRFVRK